MRKKINVIKDYLKDNTLKGLQTKPKFFSIKIILPLLIFTFISLYYGFISSLFEISFLQTNSLFLIPFILFVFPSLLEEIFFRGILIPNDLKEQSNLKIYLYIVGSTLLFVIWHPLNALTINPSAVDFFLDGRFLLITTFLGLVCGYTYVHSRSLWVPIVIHWLTVLAWVVFLGGRNLALG